MTNNPAPPPKPQAEVVTQSSQPTQSEQQTTESMGQPPVGCVIFFLVVAFLVVGGILLGIDNDYSEYEVRSCTITSKLHKDDASGRHFEYHMLMLLDELGDSITVNVDRRDYMAVDKHVKIKRRVSPIFGRGTWTLKSYTTK